MAGMFARIGFRAMFEGCRLPERGSNLSYNPLDAIEFHGDYVRFFVEIREALKRMVFVFVAFYDFIFNGTLQHRQSCVMSHFVPVAFEFGKRKGAPS